MAQQHNHSREHSCFKKRLAIAAVPAVALTTILSACGKVDVTAAVEEKRTEMERGNDSGNSVVTDVDEHINSGYGSHLSVQERFDTIPEDYQKFDEFIRSADHAKYLHEGFDANFGHVKAELAKLGDLTPNEQEIVDAFYIPDLSKPRSEWDDQDYANFRTIAVFWATGQDNPDDAKRAITAIARPGSNTFANLEIWIDNNPGIGMVDVRKVLQNPLSNRELRQAKLNNGSYISDLGGRFVYSESLASGDKLYSVYANRSDSDGHVITTLLEVADSIDDPSVRNIVQQNR